MFQPVTKENEDLHKATEGTELKITSQQKEYDLKESTGKDSDELLQEGDEGLKVCLTARIIHKCNIFLMFCILVHHTV
jgi:hypothetical protein